MKTGSAELNHLGAIRLSTLTLKTTVIAFQYNATVNGQKMVINVFEFKN